MSAGPATGRRGGWNTPPPKAAERCNGEDKPFQPRRPERGYPPGKVGPAKSAGTKCRGARSGHSKDKPLDIGPRRKRPGGGVGITGPPFGSAAQVPCRPAASATAPRGRGPRNRRTRAGRPGGRARAPAGGRWAAPPPRWPPAGPGSAPGNREGTGAGTAVGKNAAKWVTAIHPACVSSKTCICTFTHVCMHAHIHF